MVYELAVLFEGANSHGRFLGLLENGCGFSRFQCSFRQGPSLLPLGFKMAKRDKVTLRTRDQLEILDRLVRWRNCAAKRRQSSSMYL